MKTLIRTHLLENFPLSTSSDPPPGSGRYATANRMLTDMSAPSLESLRDVLGATTNSSPRYPTVFSYVVDLTTLRFRFDHRGNFEARFEADARAEFDKGEYRFRLTSRFGAKKGVGQ